MGEKQKLRIHGGDREGRGCLIPMLLFVAAILLVTGWVAARTAGARDLVEQSLGDRLGLELSIGSMHIGWPYVLVLDDVRTKAFDETPDAAGAHVQQVRLAFGGWRRVHVTLQKPTIRFCEDAKGWEPACWSSAGPLPVANLAALAPALLALQEHGYRVSARQGTVAWQDTSGQVVAWAQVPRFDVQAARVPGRPMVYCRLGVQRAQMAASAMVEGLEREWLVSPDLPYLEIGRSAGVLGGAAARFWEPESGSGGLAGQAEGAARVAGALRDVVEGPGQKLRESVRETLKTKMKVIHQQAPAPVETPAGPVVEKPQPLTGETS